MMSFQLVPYLSTIPIKIDFDSSFPLNSFLKILHNTTELSPNYTSFSLNGIILPLDIPISEFKITEFDIIYQQKSTLEKNKSLKTENLTKENDIFGYTCSNNEYFYRMPCSHIVSPDGLFDYMTIFLTSSKKLDICCPAIKTDSKPCLEKWDYKLCKEICMFSKKEKIDLENKFGQNYLDINIKFRSCPKCNSFLEKTKIFKKKIECPNCLHKFCWICQNEWTNETVQTSCEKDCGQELELYKYLVFCKRKKIGTVDSVPMIRSCPNCNDLIEHISACKHVVCKRCTYNFCFVCLKGQIKGFWQCGGYSDPCKVAKFQNIEKFLNI